MRKLSVLITAVGVAGISACNSATPPTAPDAMLVEPGVSTPPSMSAGVTSRWVGVNHAARGSVKYTVVNGIGRIDFSDDFFVSAVPGPFVYLNTTNNANTGKPLRISALMRNDGAQSYVFQVPAGMNYTWVLVWCDPFNVAVAEALLPAAP